MKLGSLSTVPQGKVLLVTLCVALTLWFLFHPNPHQIPIPASHARTAKAPARHKYKPVKPVASDPEDEVGKPIGEMKRGEVGWVSPWCMWVGKGQRWWLGSAYTAYSSERDNHTVKIRRRKDGFAVEVDWIPGDIESTGWWNPRSAPPYYCEGDARWLHVASFAWNHIEKK